MTHPTPRWHQGAALLGGFVMAMLVLVAAILSVQRNEALNSGFQVARLMAQSFEVFLTQSLNASVLAAGQAVTLDRTLDDQTGLQAELQKILRGAPHLRSVSLLDAQGRVVVSSNAVNSGKAIGLGDFYPPLDANNLVLRLGHPWFGRDFADARPAHASSSADTSLSLIPVLFPLDLHGNRFFLLFALNPDYIVNHMLQQLRPQTGEVEVLRLDGVRLLSTALNLAAGEVVDLAAWPRRPSESDAGQRATVAGNGQAALSAYQTSSLYPFLVMTHVWRAPVLDRWHVLIQTLAGVLLPLLVVTGWLAVVLYRRQIQLAQQQAEAQRLQRINAACVFSNSCEGIMITDAHGSIVDVNDAFCDITGYRRDEVLGRNPRFLSSGRHDAAFYAQFWQQLRSQGHWSGILWNRRKDGEVYAEQLTISAVQDQSGQAQQYVGMFTNITAQVQYQNKLERAAHHDALTGLPNRVMLADRLQHAMTHCQRRKNALAVLFIDLDGFKAINDQQGHDVGDQVLIELAQRMQRALRESDTLARNGGDEFVAILPDLDEPADAIATVNRLLAAAAQPMSIGQVILCVSASIGISYFPQAQPISADTLIQQADQAMYRAKQAGKNRYVVA